MSDVRILVVEDNSRYRDTIARALLPFYRDLDFANDIEDAKEHLDTKYYDVIVTDMRLQNDSSGGFAVMDWVEERKVTSVIVVLTANETVEDCRRALRGGIGHCWDYICKTMTRSDGLGALEELRESIERAIDWHGGRGSRQDEIWFDENLTELRNSYPNQFIAVLNNGVIENARTEQDLRDQLLLRKLPAVLPLIRRIDVPLARDLSVKALVELREDHTLEFKSSLLWDIQKEEENRDLYHPALKTVAGFLNANGGTLVIGVRDDGEVWGLEKDIECLLRRRREGEDGVDVFERHLRGLIDKEIGRPFSGYIDVRFGEVNGNLICAVDVLKSAEPAFCGRESKYFIRSGNKTEEYSAKDMLTHLRLTRQVFHRRDVGEGVLGTLDV